MIRAEQVLEALDVGKQLHTVLLYENIFYSYDEWEESLHRVNLEITDMQSIPIFGTYIIVIKVQKAGDTDGTEEDS